MSHSSQPESANSSISSERPKDPTFLTPVLFKDGLDRRTSARVPLGGPVRMGPPKGEPYAVVSASNLSSNGLFIDADRPVRVGARFSAEITLASGAAVYVPEAEVVYYREHVHGSGFGVRFVDPPPDALAMLKDEIDRATEPTPAPTTAPAAESAPASMPAPAFTAAPASETETVVPIAARARRSFAIDVDVSRFPEPVIPDSQLMIDGARSSSFALHGSEPLSPEPEGAPRASARDFESAFEPAFESKPKPRSLGSRWEDLMHRARESRLRMLEGARRFPRVWTVMAGVGVAGLAVALGIALWKGTRAEAFEKAPLTMSRGISATTQQVLMGERQMTASVEPAAATDNAPATESAEPPKKPLPPLVMVDDAQGVPVEKEEPVSPDVAPAPKKRAPARPSVDRKERAEHAVKAATKSESKSPAKSEPKSPAKAESKSPAKAESKSPAKAESKSPAKAESKSPAKAESKSPAKAQKPKKTADDLALASAVTKLASAPAREPKGAKTARVQIGLGRHASVVKTHVFKSPNRFVIDLQGQDAAPALPRPSGPISRIRFGKHTDFARIVIETKAPIERGLLSKDRGDLRVKLDFAD